MNKQKIHAYHSDTLSLLTLRIVLTEARKDVPPSVSRNDMNEELAAKLIRKMRKQYQRLSSLYHLSGELVHG